MNYPRNQKKLKIYLSKFNAPERYSGNVKLSQAFYSTSAAFIAISFIILLTKVYDVPLLMAPFGATCVLAFAVPDSPLAQPRNIIGGHFISAILGLLCLYLMGNTWYSMAVAVSITIGAMQLTHTIHPPAGANPLVMILGNVDWTFIFTPVLTGAILLVMIAAVFNNTRKGKRYPKYWY